MCEWFVLAVCVAAGVAKVQEIPIFIAKTGVVL
jgi:hypothetical protein